MNSEQRFHYQEDQQVLIEYIYGIIDSKIQYSKFKLERAITNSQKKEAHYPNLEYGQRPEACTSNTRELNTDILDKIEEASKIINRLLVLRVHINALNSAFIFKLLGNNAYLSYSSEDLKKLVEQKKD